MAVTSVGDTFLALRIPLGEDLVLLFTFGERFDGLAALFFVIIIFVIFSCEVLFYSYVFLRTVIVCELFTLVPCRHW